MLLLVHLAVFAILTGKEKAMKVLIKPVDLDLEDDQDQDVVAYCDLVCGNNDCTQNCGNFTGDDEVDDILF